MTGRIISTKTKNTVTVLVERVAKHPLYKKTFMRSKKYLVDSQLDVKEGDIVEIVKIRPVSKNKHWKVLKVVGRDLEEITERILKTQAEEVISKVMPATSESVDQSVNEPANQQDSKLEKPAEKPKRRPAGKKKETK